MKSTSSSIDTPRRSMRIALPWLAVALAAGMWFMTRESNASRRTFAPPTSVALVNISVLFESLDEAEASEKALDAKLERWVTEQAKAADAYRAAEEEVKLQTPWSVEWIETQRRIAEYGGKLQSLDTVLKSLKSRDRGAMYRRMYAKACVEIEKIAAAEGYDIIMLDDRTYYELDNEDRWGTRTAAETFLAITSRQIIYAKNSVDITQRVITAMNNAFHAGN
ncbi:MAG: OmpH family outer membrane protein [Phycisphaeraceae bacterium]|nr:OmpH family outer membrane protein [Phycisphaerales bacterium]MCB9859640.1 OmpH family outer membrane protein [Phycisphaeraceae bacterium]